MPWVVLDIAVVVVVLIALAAALLTTWRAVKALGRQLTSSSELLSSLTPEIAVRSQR